MSNNKQSSVNWLISQLQISTYWKYLIMEVELMECGEIDIIEQAKEMHKNEILIAYDNGWESGYYNPEEYYTEKFESKK